MRHLKIIIVLSTLGLCGLLIGVFFSFNQFKEWRAHRLYEQALSAFKEQQYEEAYNKASSARHLRPEREEYSEFIVRVAVHAGHPKMLEYMESISRYDPSWLPELKIVANYLLNQGMLHLSERYIAYLEDAPKDDYEALACRLELMQRKGDFNSIIQLVEPILKEPDLPFKVHRQYIMALLKQGGDIYRTQALAHLKELCERNDSVGSDSLELWLQLDHLHGNSLEVAQRLREHPEAEPLQRMQAIACLVREGEIAADGGFEFLEEADSRSKIESTRQFAQILANWSTDNVYQFLEGRLEEVHTDYGLFLLWMKTKLKVGEYQEVYRYTSESTSDMNPLSSLDNLMLRAQAYKGMGNLEAYQETLILAEETATLQEVNAIERSLLLERKWGLLTEFYDYFMSLRSAPKEGDFRFIFAHYQMGNDIRLKEHLQHLKLDDYKDIPAMQVFLAYLKTLYSEDKDHSRLVLERWYSEYPWMVDFRLPLAFIYQENGLVQEAKTLVENQRLNVEELPRHCHIILAILYHQWGESELSRQHAEAIDGRNILYAEKKLLAQNGLG